MKQSIDVAKGLGAREIEIEAQCYAIPFYEKVGFEVSSEEFILDGILHKRMRLLVYGNDEHPMQRGTPN